jgi:hypothetical protein
VTAEQKSTNKASGHAKVGMQIGFVGGDVNTGPRASTDDTATDLAAQIEEHLAAQIEELREAVRALRARAELTDEAASMADYELAAAVDLVPQAAGGDKRELMDRMRRVGEVLQQGLRVLAQVADVVSTVKRMT